MSWNWVDTFAVACFCVPLLSGLRDGLVAGLLKTGFLLAGLLLLCVLPQTVVLLRDTHRTPRGPLTPAQKAEFTTVTLGLWGVTALPPALGQASTLLVAAILGPEAAGGSLSRSSCGILPALASALKIWSVVDMGISCRRPPDRGYPRARARSGG